MRQQNDIAAVRVRGPNRLAFALTVSLAAHVGLIALLGSHPQYPWAKVPSALEVRIASLTAAGVGQTEPVAEAIESTTVASRYAIPPANRESDARPSSHPHASQVEETRATNQRQAVDAPVPIIEEPPIATLQASPPSGTTYYADSEVDAMPVALDPIVPRYPSGADAGTDGGKVTLRLLIDTGGVVKDVAVVETGLSEVFEESARNAFAGIRFKPAEKDGIPVGCQTVISIVYAPSGIPHAVR